MGHSCMANNDIGQCRLSRVALVTSARARERVREREREREGERARNTLV